MSSWDFLCLYALHLGMGSADCLACKLLVSKLTSDLVSLGTTVFLSLHSKLWRVFAMEVQLAFVVLLKFSEAKSHGS